LFGDLAEQFSWPPSWNRLFLKRFQFLLKASFLGSPPAFSPHENCGIPGEIQHWHTSCYSLLENEKKTIKAIAKGR